MLICTKCDHKQDAGKFCGKCGGELKEFDHQDTTKTNTAKGPENNAETDQVQKQEAEPEIAATTFVDDESTEPNNLTNEFSQYGKYFLNVLKNPTSALQFNQNHFGYGLINMGIFILTIILSLFFLIRYLFKNIHEWNLLLTEFGEGASESFPFSGFDFFLNTAFGLIILIAIAFFSTFIFTKLTTNRVLFKDSVGVFGSLIIPFVAINVLAILTGFSGSAMMTLSLISMSLFFSIFIVPALIVLDTGTTHQHKHRAYYSLGASALALFITYFVARSFIVTKLLSIIEELQYL